MTDEELRRAFQAGTSTNPTGRRECPGAEAISSLVEQEGKEADRLALLDHVMTCPACRRDFELMRSVHVAAPTASHRRLLPLALAASVALLLGLGGMGLWSSRGTDRPDLRRGSAEVELVTPASGALVNLPVQLTWRPMSGTPLYTVELLAGDGRLIQSWVTADTTVSVPAAPTPTISAGDYAWWVKARLSDGAERRSSMIRFQVR